MILPVLKYCTPIYLLLAGISLVVIKRGAVTLPAVLVFLSLIAAIIVLGLLFGMILSVLIKNPQHERTFYWIGQVIAFLLIVLPFGKALYDSYHS
jgi:hypothetical protein